MSVLNQHLNACFFKTKIWDVVSNTKLDLKTQIRIVTHIGKNHKIL